MLEAEEEGAGIFEVLGTVVGVSGWEIVSLGEGRGCDVRRLFCCARSWSVGGGSQARGRGSCALGGRGRGGGLWHRSRGLALRGRRLVAWCAYSEAVRQLDIHALLYADISSIF